jgi:uncharacterized membrane protein
LVPADAIHGTDQQTADVEEHAAVEEETSSSKGVSAVRPYVGTVEIALHERLWERRSWYVVEEVVRRVGNAVQDADSPL